jgi:AraC-like DNA-binding protein
VDKFFSLLPRYGFNATVFFHGEFCGQTQFSASEGVAHLHLVQQGPVLMKHNDGPPLNVVHPTLVFYPRPYDHRLEVSSDNIASLICAKVQFNYADRNPIVLALPDVICVPLSAEAGLSSVISLLVAEASREDIGKKLTMDHLCDILVVHLIRHACKMDLIRTGAIAGLSDAQLAPVLSALHTEAGRTWTVEGMATIAHMSRTSFIKRFRDVIGLPPAEYLTRWRMELAQTYLKEGKPVKEVAQAVGYKYQPGFTKAFTSWFGVPPTEWRKVPQ